MRRRAILSFTAATVVLGGVLLSGSGCDARPSLVEDRRAPAFRKRLRERRDGDATGWPEKGPAEQQPGAKR